MTREQLIALAAEGPSEEAVQLGGEIVFYDPAEWARYTLRLMALADPTAEVVKEDPAAALENGRPWDLDSQ